MQSTSPISGRTYNLPKKKNDKKNIDLFLLKNKGKKVIVVQGLGFVGSVMSLVCANSITEEYAVIGIDLLSKESYWKIRSMNEGDFPVIASDPKIDLYYKKAISKGNLYATYDPYAFSCADTIIVDINLDVSKSSDSVNNLENYEVDLSGFKNAIRSIGENCKDSVLILIETTVPPGTCENIILPEIKNCLKKRNKSTNEVNIGHSYERVMPGPNYINSIQNYFRVFSGIDDRSADAVESFLKTIIRTDEYPLKRLGNTNATEMAKVLENSYRAMNISFMVEWSRFAEESNVNLYEVVNAIRMRETHANMMLPGLGVGGYCLTKDPLLASWARQNIFNKSPLIQSELGVMTNDRMPFFAYEYLIGELQKNKILGGNILLLGVSYRGNVGDTRYSPVEYLYNFLKRDKFNIILHDPYVKYWEEKELYLDQSLSQVLKNNINILVFSTAHDDYKNSDTLINKLNERSGLLIFDTVGVLSERVIGYLSKKHIVRVLGRGDLT